MSKQLLEMPFPAGQIDKNEELLPELAETLQFGEDNAMFPVINHPLYVGPVTIPGVVNYQYRLRKAALEQAEVQKDWKKWVFSHTRAFRVSALVEMSTKIIDDREYWRLVMDVLTDSENLHQEKQNVRTLLNADRLHREAIMLPSDREYLESLNQEFTIYRGFSHEDSRAGWSWTLDREKAEWFANRYSLIDGSRPEITTARVKKTDVIAYNNERNEKTIICDHRHVDIVETENLPCEQMDDEEC